MHVLRLLCLPVLISAAYGQTPRVVISELCAANNLTLRDQDRDYPDWIEIHNADVSNVDLGGWYLTDSSTDRTKWRLPSPTVLMPGQFVVVFASGKNRALSGRELHTSFRLSARGEHLALVAPDGRTVVSTFGPFPEQFADQSYGFAFSPSLTTRRVYFATPTPGKPNGTGVPIIGRVAHAPAKPASTDPIVVTAQVIETTTARVNGVALYWRVQFGTERALLMRDDGRGNDAKAGDGVWTATIPAGTAPGQMLRWRVEAAWIGGGTRSPLYQSRTESPQYHGAMIADPNVSSRLPTLFWFVQDPRSAETSTGTRCSVWFDGELYDNLLVRRRGGSSTGWRKKNFKFDFNRGHHFRFDPNQERAEEINVNSTWSDKAFIRRVLSYETYDGAGVAGSLAFPLRVQQNGSFYSVAHFIEQPDVRLLEREGLDPRGALYKMFNTLSSATSRVEKRTRLNESNADLQALVNGIRLSGTALERYLFDNVDLPAVISYMAAVVLIHDNDHVHKNYFLYRDTEGDREWRFVPWDKDLTFGRNYHRSRGVLNDLIWADRDPHAHPLIGDSQHRNTDGFWNYLIDACHRQPRVRQMFLRRLRTVMDELLQAPGTPRANRKLEARIDALKVLMDPDVARDRARWGIPAWGNRSYDFATALRRLETEYLEPRRRHLFVTHSASTTGIIPPPQRADVSISFGDIVAAPRSNVRDQEYIEIVNCSSSATDISGWRLGGGVRFTFAPGTVIPAGESLYASPNPTAFRSRTTGPRGNQGLLVVGPYDGHLSTKETIHVVDRRQREVARSGGFAYSIATTGLGDVTIQIDGAQPFAELFHLFSASTSHKLGCGPVLGLGVDALLFVGLPLGFEPFHVRADASGSYRFSAGAGTFPRVTLDSRVVAFDRNTSAIVLSHPRRVRY